jgi:3-phenylpropionate/trans-cinnamate dioxygenase ferredoxin subunit
MTRHVVCTLAELPPGTQRQVKVAGRAIAIFNVDGKLYGLRDVCPHRGAQLSGGIVVGAISAASPGCYEFDNSRKLVKCPWHRWEFDLATGQSWLDPEHERVRPYSVSVASGATFAGGGDTEQLPTAGPYTAETVRVSVEDDYVVVED